jgi:probable rRNA maturation factor
MTCLVRIEGFAGELESINDIDFGSIASSVLKAAGKLDASSGYVADLRFVSADEIQQINNKTRSVNKPTDVLSFPSMHKPGQDKRRYPYDDESGLYFLGDIIICPTAASAQAIEYGHSEKREVSYLFAHGMCHLLGYDHKRKYDKAQMRAIEESALKAAING